MHRPSSEFRLRLFFVCVRVCVLAECKKWETKETMNKISQLIDKNAFGEIENSLSAHTCNIQVYHHRPDTQYTTQMENQRLQFTFSGAMRWKQTEAYVLLRSRKL